VGIAGSYPDPAGRSDSMTRETVRGWISRNGMLTYLESKSVRDAADGTSKTILAAEQSGVVGVYENGRFVDYPIGCSGYCGGWAGDAMYKAGLTEGINTWPSGQVISRFNTTGVTTVMYPLNADCYTENSCMGSYEANTILNSHHPGLVQALFTDGSVHGLSDTIDMETLRRLCAADDGLMPGDYE
jgi:hypothetical protein